MDKEESKKTSSINSLIDVMSYDQTNIKLDCDNHRKYKYWSFKHKALFGFAYGSFGFFMVVNLVCIQIYQVLIHTNECLFYEFNPPCENNAIKQGMIDTWNKCHMVLENYRGFCG